MNSNQNINADDDTSANDDNQGPSPLDTAAISLDDAVASAILFYETNKDRSINIGPNEGWVVLVGGSEMTGSFMLSLPVLSDGSMPFNEQDHYPDELLECVMPLRQDDGSIKIGFIPKANVPLNVPGVIVYPYMDSTQNIVGNAVVVVVVVPGLAEPIAHLLTDDLLEEQSTMDIQHAEAYVANAQKGAIVELVIPLHTGYAEGPNGYATGGKLGQSQIDDPDTTGDNSLRYYVFDNAPTGMMGAIERNFMRSAGNEIVHYPTVVVLRAKPAYLKSKLYRINWRKLLTSRA